MNAGSTLERTAASRSLSPERGSFTPAEWETIARALIHLDPRPLSAIHPRPRETDEGKPGREERAWLGSPLPRGVV